MHQIAVQNANIDGGNPSGDPGAVRAKGKGYEACYVYEGERACYTYDGFEGKDGKVVDFNINRLELEKRLIVGNGAFKPGTGLGVQGKFVSAYVTTSSENLDAALQLRSSDTPISIIAASYRSPDGRQSNAQYINGPFELGARSLSNYLLVFPGAKLGGTLTLEYFVEGGSSASMGLPRLWLTPDL